ncbi:hypothetical protein GCM10017044_20790 [Kordiimonas sediminis]|uniref:SnoaL-like domain-containing protein n=1 Tax=Kordiimonas sediminis TaxID=1735581 RepID=A0A919ATU4_9PROT|nr:nuclear transport factor 2 family protein [Kordiimonas sediminis]GHF25803.1 hypothetical protein GCM10017044_20790 [Kordiimonas sediminis]
MHSSPRDTIIQWVAAFNAGDANRITDFYADHAVNHQVMFAPVVGKQNIRAMFAKEFEAYEMVCEIENIFEDGDWGILEWRDPLGLRGCGFFQFKDGLIIHQRGYWDRQSFSEAQTIQH